MSNQSPEDVVYVLFTHNIGVLEGRVLTYLDAIISDPVQRKASKDIIRPMLWNWAVESNFADVCEIKRKHDGFVFTNSVATAQNQKTV